MATLTPKGTTSTTVTEYNTIRWGSWSLDFKKSVTSSATTITCYPTLSGTNRGFISYNVGTRAFLFQLNNTQATELATLTELFTIITDCIKQIA